MAAKMAVTKKSSETVIFPWQGKGVVRWVVEGGVWEGMAGRS